MPFCISTIAIALVMAPPAGRADPVAASAAGATSAPAPSEPAAAPAEGAAPGEGPAPSDGAPSDGEPFGPEAQVEPEPEPPEDRRAALPTVKMENVAGSPVPGARPNAFPERTGSRLSEYRERRRAGGGPSRGGGPAAGGDWKFQFHGYLRAPMRIGQGRRENPGEGQKATTYHLPVIPDDQYLSYQYTLHNPRDWAELYLGYGNDVVTGMVSIQAFNFTDAAWNENQAQFGIAQGFVTFTPKLKPQWVRLLWRVGSFDNRYGAAGRYDAGELDTYVFGRTHAMGEVGQVDFLVKDFTISVEHGFGATRPDPSVNNTARFTLLHHAHLGLGWRGKVQAGGHFLQAFAREEFRVGDEANMDLPDGRMTVIGPDVRIDWGRIGYLYGGFSYIRSETARTVGTSIEVLHSKGAGAYTFGIIDNYLEGPTRTSNGNGEIYSLMGQYEHSVQRILKGDRWWGEGRDLSAKVYMMVNRVRSEDDDADETFKLKYGADLVFSALPWLGVAARYDRVQPTNKLPEQSFSILSPRILFRSHWVTREEIALQYSRYFYNQRTCPPTGDPELCVQPPSAPVPPEGFGAPSQDGNRGAPTRVPDENVISLKATMWW